MIAVLVDEVLVEVAGSLRRPVDPKVLTSAYFMRSALFSLHFAAAERLTA